MKLSPEVLVEVMNIFTTGLTKQQDISQMLRDLDLVVNPNDPSHSTLALATGYRPVGSPLDQEE